MKKNDPPSSLSAESQSLWKQVVRGDVSPSRIEMLTQAFLCLDRLRQIQTALNASELVTITPRSGASHLNPLAKLEIETRRQFFSAWAALRLNFTGIDGSARNTMRDLGVDADDE